MRFRSGDRRFCCTALLGCALLGSGFASAAAQTYQLTVPAGKSATYTLQLDVRRPGDLTVVGEWQGTRTLAFRLDPPGGRLERTVRRAGASPLRMVAEVDEGEVGTWTLQIHALAAGGRVDGTMTVETPAPPPAAPALPTEPAEIESAAAVDPWLLPRRLPVGLPERWRPFLQAAESFRAELARPFAEAPPDSCRWQSALMLYLANARDELLEKGRAPDSGTRDFLGRVADAIGAVEQLRSTNDPLLAGPPPDDPSLRDAWHQIRSSRMHELESRLDELLRLVRRGHVPVLEREKWTVRLVSCLIACEQFFDERTVVGADRAANRALATDQWERLRLAGRALGSLAGIEGERAGR